MGCGGSKPSSGGGAGAPGQPASAKGDQKIQMTPDGSARIVMQKYKMFMGKDDVMGEGTSSICRKGQNIEDQSAVAIKIYKGTQKQNAKQEEVMMLKFKRQVEVLNDLQKPFEPASDETLWCDVLASAKPSSLFMLLIDYSKDKSGKPAQDPTDGVVYVVTELAQYSLKDYFALRREQHRPLPIESVKNVSRGVILVVAGLHAKGLCHLDLKPENLMMFNGRLKLIDVDGCVKIGTTVSISDSSISFSPCYCAPEWAQFLINESNQKITVHPALDVWSVGMTICELVSLNAILKPMYGNFLRNAHSHREAGFLFMDWLSTIKKVPLPKNIEKFDDKEFLSLVTDFLLVPDWKKRKSCAQALGHPYIASGKDSGTRDMTGEDVAGIQRQHRARVEDESNPNEALYKGMLWKLDTNGDPSDASKWRERDMWMLQAGSLCYWSVKENKRLVLLDGATLASSTIKLITEQPTKTHCKPNVFTITYHSDSHDKEGTTLTFAVNTKEEYVEWNRRLTSVNRMDMPTMRLGGDIAELRKMVVNVRNRRGAINVDEKEAYEPLDKKGKLWKLKGDSDINDARNWFEREMWVAKNKSLVYYSVKEERELVYYTQADLFKATFKKDDSPSAKPNVFQILLPPAGDVEFAPGIFAAESPEERNEWIDRLTAAQGKAK